MATSTYGLIQTDPKKKFTLQTAQANVDDPDQSGGTALPTANFANLPTIAAPAARAANATLRPAAVPANFQFTGRYDAANRGLLQQESDAGLARRNNLADVDEQYRNASQRSGDLAAIARTQLQENMASRGLMMSGINAQATGQQETQYNQYLQDLAASRARALAGIETDYAGVLNQSSRSREGLFFDQQQEEEERRLQEERLKAEATARQQQADQQAQALQQMQAAQEAARQAAMAAAAAASRPSYQPTQIGGGGGGGYGGPPPSAQPVQQQNGNWVQAPHLAQGTTMASFGNWVHNNLDANASPNAIKAVLNVFNANGGASLSDLAWLIQQYPNQQAQPTNDRTTYGGRFQ